MQNIVLRSVKEKHISNIQLKNVKFVEKNINQYELQVSFVLLNVVLQIRKTKLFLYPFSYL
jgi:hypothetical protein